MTNREKLVQIRKLLKEAYDHYFDNCQDCGCKSGEGHISLEFGNYWEDPNCELNITSVCIRRRIACTIWRFVLRFISRTIYC